MTHLEIGDKVPDFVSIIQDESEVSAKSMLGKKYILFFYPKDDTPGCTREACNLRDNYRWFEKNGYTILGASPDTTKKHLKFIDKYEFQYSLIADTDKELIKAFGVWGEKKFMGRTFDGVHRTTFVIDENGIITNIIKKVKTKEHAEQLMEAIG